MGYQVIILSKQQVEKTPTFKGLSKILKMIISRRKNILILQHGLNVATHLGHDTWAKQSNLTWPNRNIVKDLL